MAEEKEDKQSAPKFAKTVLADRILLVSDNLAVEIFVGGSAKFQNGKAEIGVSFGDINEAKIRRKNRTAQDPQSANALENFIKARRAEQLKVYKTEVLAKLKEVGVAKEDLEAVNKAVKTEDLAYLLN